MNAVCTTKHFPNKISSSETKDQNFLFGTVLDLREPTKVVSCKSLKGFSVVESSSCTKNELKWAACGQFRNFVFTYWKPKTCGATLGTCPWTFLVLESLFKLKQSCCFNGSERLTIRKGTQILMQLSHTLTVFRRRSGPGPREMIGRHHSQCHSSPSYYHVP